MVIPLLSWAVLVVSREAFIQTSVGGLTASLTLQEGSESNKNKANVHVYNDLNAGVDLQESDDNTTTSKSIKSYLSFNDAMSIIQQKTPTEFIDAVMRTERFLYRGEKEVGSNCALMIPEPDLLLFDTYANDDALGYFEQLEKCTSILTSTDKMFQVRPSNGHIATSVYSDAAAWGTPVSIWPVGSSFSYAYPRYRTLFFDEITNPVNACTIGSNCRVDVDYDHGLSNALKMGKEIMFATLTFDAHTSSSTSLDDSAFVAIPTKYDRDILSILKS